jgi:hypothetical protein
MTDDKDFWIQTFTGKQFYPLNPEESEYCIEDIAHALSNICRFTGHCHQFYSVAQHSVLVSELLSPELALAGLLHDASEAYITDIARPLKHLPEFEGYRRIEKRTEDAIFKIFGVVNGHHPDIKGMDALLLRNEAKCLGLLRPVWHHYSLPDLGLNIKPVLPKVAEEAFLSRWNAIRDKAHRQERILKAVEDG